MENSVVLIAHSNLFNVRILESGIASERQFHVRAFAISWAEGQGLRLGVPVTYDAGPRTAAADASPPTHRQPHI